MENKLKIFNLFGKKPTNTYISAGMDFYIPSLSNDIDENIIKAICKSYNITKEDFNNIEDIFSYLLDISELSKDNLKNIVFLYLMLDSSYLNKIKNSENIKFACMTFFNEYLVFSKDSLPGIQMNLNDSLFVNSGIKLVLPKGTAGIFDNKSGMANKGWDIRADVVDEDYSGFVHLSMAFTKEPDGKNNIIYIGDKLNQLIIFDVHHLEPEEINENEYNYIMKDSSRGEKGFGSSNIKH